MNARAAQLAVLILLGGLVACTEPSVKKVHAREEAIHYPSGFDPTKDPYWEDMRWDRSLLDALQSAVHDPVDVGDMSTPGLRATVKFTFQDGVVEYPEIIQGTGDAEMDKLMLH